jgi:hypothetical protein
VRLLLNIERIAILEARHFKTSWREMCPISPNIEICLYTQCHEAGLPRPIITVIAMRVPVG